jgi:uncharacterized membrane protein YesL
MAKEPSDLLSGAEVGDSAFARLTAAVLWFIVLGLLAIVTSLPGYAVALFLGRSLSNLPFLILCLIPVGPSASALLFAWRRRQIDGPDLSPARRYWRGYRLNARDVLAWWIPALVVIAARVFVVLHIGATAGPAQTGWVVLALVILLTLVACHLIVVTSLFSFRLRDAIRLSLYASIRHWPVTLGYACLLAAMAGLTWSLGEWLVALAGSILGLWWLKLAGPVIATITSRFVLVEPDQAGGEPEPTEPKPALS